jgi:hypothetical protein
VITLYGEVAGDDIIWTWRACLGSWMGGVGSWPLASPAHRGRLGEACERSVPVAAGDGSEVHTPLHTHQCAGLEEVPQSAATLAFLPDENGAVSCHRSRRGRWCGVFSLTRRGWWRACCGTTSSCSGSSSSSTALPPISQVGGGRGTVRCAGAGSRILERSDKKDTLESV